MSINKDPPALLGLPPEIRLQICSYLLIRPTLNLCRKPNDPGLWTSNSHNILSSAQRPTINSTALATALLLTCKKIYEEASGVLYSRNTFGFHDPKVLLTFLVQIGQINTGHVRALHIIVPWNQEKWAFWPSELLHKLSSDAKNLRSMEIIFQRAPRYAFRQYGVGSQDDIVSLLVGRRLGLEFNLGLALGTLLSLEKVIVWGCCGEVWLECLRKRIGCKVLSMYACRSTDRPPSVTEIVGKHECSPDMANTGTGNHIPSPDEPSPDEASPYSS
jgi:hypothetical protein